MRLAVILLTVLLLTGCSGRATAPGAPAGENCGTEEERLPNEHNAQARECLWQAYSAGRPAEFTKTVYTAEGDPIIYIVKVVAADRITVSRDTTRDEFSAEADRKVTVSTCEQMERESGVLRFSGCKGDANTVIRL